MYTKTPPIIAVSGVKNSGKTTFLEKLIPLLRERGYRIAVIKHDGHDFIPDVPGTDSFRLSNAGAEGTAVFSNHRFMVVRQVEGTSVETISRLFADMDLILVEGLKRSSYPKLEIIRDEFHSVCCFETLLAIVTNTDIKVGRIPVLPLYDAAPAADLIECYLKKTVLPARDGGSHENL